MVRGSQRDLLGKIGESRELKELTMRTTFVRVTQQLNEVFGKS